MTDYRERVPPRRDAERAARPRDMGEWLPTLAEAVRAFLDDATLAGLSRATVKSHRSRLAPLRADSSPIGTLTPERCRSLILARLEGTSDTARTLHSTLTSFSNYCVERGWLLVSPMAHVPRPKKRTRPHRYLTVDQVRAVWDACRDDYARLILCLLLLGLRAGELTRLRWQDVDWERKRLLVAFTKGGNPRTVLLDDRIMALLAKRDRTDPRIAPMSVTALEQRMTVLGKRAGIPRLHPHLWRHTFATQFLLTAGVEEIATLQMLGGWADTRMITSTYARSVMEELALNRAGTVGLSNRLLGE